MKIAEIEVKKGFKELQGVVVNKQETRTWSKFGQSGQVCSGVLRDETGTVDLSLWNDDCDKVQVGDIIKITDGYTGEFQGQPNVSTGKNGKLEIVGKDKASAVKKKDSSYDEIPEDVVDI